MSRFRGIGFGFVSVLAACGSADEYSPHDLRENTGETSAMLSEGAGGVEPRFLVGSTTMVVRDPARAFDPWNAIYGSAEYQNLLGQLAALDEPRTLVTEIWYPVSPPRGCNPRKPRPDRCAIPETRRATYLDYYSEDRGIFDRRGVSPYLVTASGQTVGDLASTDPGAHAVLVDAVLDELAARERASFLDAPIANGSFPLVILSHGGFTGNIRPDSHREIFTSEAEYLASLGYIVVAMNHTGDSRLPTVFHDGRSKLEEAGGPAAVAAAYEILFSQAAVPDRITSIIFQPGGFPIAHTMMQRLFEMRADDVESVLAAMKELDSTPGAFLEGAIDTGRIGVAGFSLGSMTAQVVLSSVDDVATGMSWNNGLPNAWEPARFDGLEKPHFFSLSYEDDLSRTFFTNVPFFIYPTLVVGGQPSDFLFLPGERSFPPTLDNPEPVVRTCYERAGGPKLLLGLVDATHWDLTDYDDYLFPRHRLEAGEILVAFDNVLRHLPFGADVLDPDFVGAPFETMSWERDRRGNWTYRPHEIRNYYASAWYGLYLQGKESFRHRLRRDPFRDTVVLKEGVDHR